MDRIIRLSFLLCMTKTLLSSVLDNIENLSPPSKEETEATFQAATVLRENVITALATALQNPYLNLNSRERAAMENIHDGFRNRDIDTVDMVGNLQHLTNRSNQEQFIGLMQLLRYTIPHRFICQAVVSQQAAAMNHVDFNSLLPQKYGYFVPIFYPGVIQSLWFTNVSRKLGAICGRQSRLYREIMEGFRRGQLPLTAKVYANLILHLHYFYMSPDAYEMLKYISSSIIKNEERLQVLFSNVRTTNFKNIFGMSRSVLKFIRDNNLVDENKFNSYSSVLLCHMTKKGIRVLGFSKVRQFVSPLGLKTNLLFRDVDLSNLPSDVVQAAKQIKEAFDLKQIRLPISDIQRFFNEYDSHIEILIALLQKISIQLPETSKYQPLLKSLVIHLRVKYYVDKGMVYAPVTGFEVLSLLDAFGSFELPVTFLHLKLQIIKIFNKNTIRWDKVLANFPFHQYINPRPLFLYIIKRCIQTKELFTQEELCHSEMFVDQFIISGQDILFAESILKSQKVDGYTDSRKSCIASCLDLNESLSESLLSTNSLQEISKTSKQIEGSSFQQSLSMSGVSSKIVNPPIGSANVEFLLAALREDAPKNNIEYLRNYFQHDEKLNILSNFDYKTNSSPGHMLKNLLQYLRVNDTNPELATVIDSTLKYLEIKELNENLKAPNINLTSVFNDIRQDILSDKDKLILGGILRYFKEASETHPTTTCSECPNPNVDKASGTNTMMRNISSTEQNSGRYKRNKELTEALSHTDQCYDYTVTIWNISRNLINIKAVLQAISRSNLPSELRNPFDELVQWFSNKTVDFASLVGNLDAGSFPSRGVFLEAVFDTLRVNKSVKENLKETMLNLYQYISKDGTGAKPVDIIKTLQV